jgi:hypothetical protein
MSSGALSAIVRATLNVLALKPILSAPAAALTSMIAWHNEPAPELFGLLSALQRTVQPA